jgi:pimeloyl-ACP methyl ester carboxylesterase
VTQTIQTQVEENTLEFRGFRFVVRTATAGVSATEPLVILGGSSQDRFSWLRYERLLLEHTSSMLTVELPGYGDADPLPAEYGMDFLADAVCQAIDELSPGPVNLFGGCFGGLIALQLARRQPERIARLMLLGVAGEMAPEYVVSARRWTKLADAGRFDDVAEDMIRQFMTPPHLGFVRRRDVVERLLRQGFATRKASTLTKGITHRERLLSHPWSLPAAAPRCPVLVTAGEHDLYTPPAAGRRVARGLGAPFATIKEADHLVHIERDTDVAELMARFFTDRPIEHLPCLNPVEYPGAEGRTRGLRYAAEPV